MAGFKDLAIVGLVMSGIAAAIVAVAAAVVQWHLYARLVLAEAPTINALTISATASPAREWTDSVHAINHPDFAHRFLATAESPATLRPKRPFTPHAT
jgi:hypothetical protein